MPDRIVVREPVVRTVVERRTDRLVVRAPGPRGEQGVSGVLAATAPATYDAGTRIVGVAVGTAAGTVAAGNDGRFAALSAADAAEMAARQAADALLIPLAQKGAPSGVAPLDASSFILDAYLPSTIARTADIAAAVNALVDSAPGSLDTLNELAAALGDDANFAATVTTSLAGKMAKAANLSDVASVATARANLGLGTAALASTADFDPVGSAAAVQAALTAHITNPLHPYLASAQTWTADQTIGSASKLVMQASATTQGQIEFETRTTNGAVKGPWTIQTGNASTDLTDHTLLFAYNAKWRDDSSWSRVTEGEHIVRMAIESRYGWDGSHPRGVVEWNLDVDPTLTGAPAINKRVWDLKYAMDAGERATTLVVGDVADRTRNYYVMYGALDGVTQQAWYQSDTGAEYLRHGWEGSSNGDIVTQGSRVLGFNRTTGAPVQIGRPANPVATSMYGTRLLQGQASGSVVDTIQGAAGQAADLTRWLNSGGTVLAKITPAGYFRAERVGIGTDPVYDIHGDRSVNADVIWFNRNTSTGTAARSFFTQQSSISEIDLLLNGSGYTGGVYSADTGALFASTAELRIANYKATTGSIKFDVGNTFGGASERMRLTEGGLLVKPGVAGSVPFTVQAATSQTANVGEIKNAAGTVLAKWDNNASFFTSGGLGVGTLTALANQTFIAQAYATNFVAGLFKGLAGQTADLVQVQNSAGAVLAKIDVNGGITSVGGILGGQLNAYAATASTIPLVVRGAASQAVDLIQVQDSTGAVKSKFDALGRLTVGYDGPLSGTAGVDTLRIGTHGSLFTIGPNDSTGLGVWIGEGAYYNGSDWKATVTGVRPTLIGILGGGLNVYNATTPTTLGQSLAGVAPSFMLSPDAKITVGAIFVDNANAPGSGGTPGIERLKVRAVPGQSAEIVRVETSAGGRLWAIASGGQVTNDSGLQVAGAHTGQDVIRAVANDASKVPLAIVLAASHTARAIEIRNSAGTTIAEWSYDGSVYAVNLSTDGNLSVRGGAFETGAAARIKPINTGAKGVVIRGNAGQSAELLDVQDSAGTSLARFSGAGHLFFAAGLGVFMDYPAIDRAQTGAYLQTNPAGTNGGSLMVVQRSAGNTALLARLAASPTANALEIQDSGSAVLAAITSAGMHKWAAANEQTTVGVAGAASVLPLTPTKYLKVKDSAGTTLVVPAYAAA